MNLDVSRFSIIKNAIRFLSVLHLKKVSKNVLRLSLLYLKLYALFACQAQKICALR